ncbi:hypothetical protein V6N12_054453 [Hibiscus sabdariffa]|uniref:Uncharacterized protein n=1 Tax=Hibiscus sabdariffa TaxID=183260 RepID=A0ABR2D375_9ROSI
MIRRHLFSYRIDWPIHLTRYSNELKRPSSSTKGGNSAHQGMGTIGSVGARDKRDCHRAIRVYLKSDGGIMADICEDTIISHFP